MMTETTFADVLGGPPREASREEKLRRVQIFCTFCGRYHRLSKQPELEERRNDNDNRQ
jgi:hypothetical protein